MKQRKTKHNSTQMVGVTPQKINTFGNKSKSPLLPAYEYAKKLGVKELKGN